MNYYQHIYVELALLINKELFNKNIISYSMYTYTENSLLKMK